MKSPILLRLATVLLVSIPLSVTASSPSYQEPAFNSSGADVLHVMGSLQSLESIAVVSQVDGVVESYAHDVGEQTSGGTSLVTINQEDYLLAMERARASLAQANAELVVKKSRYDRYKRLVAQNNLAREQLENAEADYLVSKADLRLQEVSLGEAELALARTQITAENGLWVSERLINKGDWVHSGQKLYQLEQIEKLKAVVYITEEHVNSFASGQGVTLTAEAVPGHYFSGHIRTIAIQTDTTRNSYPVEIVIDNPGMILRPGFTVDAEVSLTNLVAEEE
ncbi:efflux RND transporter periplasmic adaptor subunit [Endozoicomonas sp.]|uniref:efflux RND transporter periplasmic adaptor subunit n=1 Tax=Endozoicomonas sp. TaxID=1892382 RepID=UPI003AF52EE9